MFGWISLENHQIHLNQDLNQIKYQTMIFQAVNVYFVMYLIKL